MADQMLAKADTIGLRDFGAWMTAEQRRVFLLCRRFLQDPDEADSATQDVFLKAYQAFQRPDFKEIDDPAKWVTRIAVNTCLDRLRSKKWQFWRKRPKPEEEMLILGMAASGNPNAEDRYFAEEIKGRLALALNKLSARQRAVFTLRHHEGHSLDEIAELLQLDPGTVKAHMFRAVGKLREELRDLYGSRGKK